VARDFENIFKFSRQKIQKKIWVAHGKKCYKFYNKGVKSLRVQLYSTENEGKSCIVERWIRAMRGKMFKHLSANNTR